MTNLREDDLNELDFAEKHSVEPGFYSKTLYSKAGHKIEEYSDEKGLLHHWTGPAFTGSGIREWYIHGQKIECGTQEEFEEIRDRLIKLKVFW